MELAATDHRGSGPREKGQGSLPWSLGQEANLKRVEEWKSAEKMVAVRGSTL